MKQQLKPRRNGIHINFSDHAIVLALVIFWAVLAVSNAAFSKFSIYATIIKEASMYAVCGVGMTFAIISGELDMSVASQIALSSVVFTAVVDKLVPSNPGLSLILTCLLILVMGAAMGLVNGVLIAGMRIPSFIATLAMQNIFRGLAQLVNDAPVPIATLGKEYQVFTSGVGKAVKIGTIGDFNLLYIKGFGFTKILGLPLFFYVMLALAILGTVILRKTRLGRNILAIGNSKDAARIAGINIPRTQIATYVLIGVFTGMTALMMTSNLGSSNYGVPTGTEFTVISAVVLGGTALSGGKGSIFNTVIASLFMATISIALTTFGISNNAYGIFRGCILVIAFSINTIRAIVSEAAVKRNARLAAKKQTAQAVQ